MDRISDESSTSERARKPGPVNLRKVGISEELAAELRWRFQCLIEDWADPAMDIYDDSSEEKGN